MKPKKVIPPLYFFVLLVVSIGLGVYLPVVNVVGSPYRYLGFAPIGLGIVLNLWADSQFKKNKTTVKPHETPSSLMKSGAFSVSRNPMYLGMVLILLGVSICAGSLTAFISPIVFFLVSEYRFIPLEESVMESVFGKAYLEYKRRVRRWL